MTQRKRSYFLTFLMPKHGLVKRGLCQTNVISFVLQGQDIWWWVVGVGEWTVGQREGAHVNMNKAADSISHDFLSQMLRYYQPTKNSLTVSDYQWLLINSMTSSRASSLSVIQMKILKVFTKFEEGTHLQGRNAINLNIRNRMQDD